MVSQYAGQSTVTIRPTQLYDVSAREQNKAVDEWCEFFAAGPSPIYDLTIATRLPKRLFDSLAGQTQLRKLSTSWGVYDDLAALGNMPHLAELHLESATSVTTIEPLRTMTQLLDLTLGNTVRLRDFSPLGELTNLRQLTIGGGGEARIHAESLNFLLSLRELRKLNCWVVPIDLDYSVVLALDWIEEIDLVEAKGMNPSLMDLEWSVPGIARLIEERRVGNNYVWEKGVRIGDYRRDQNGESFFFRYGDDGSGR